MKILRVLSALLAATTLLAGTSACSAGGASIAPSGRVAMESRPVPPFTAIAVSLPGEVVLRQGPFAPVLLEADDNLLPEIETTVEERTLKLRFKRPISVSGRKTMRLTVTAPAFDSIGVAGSGDVSADLLRAGDLAVSVAGSGDVKFGQLECASLKLSLAGSGDFRAAGRAGEFKANIAGSGDIDAARLETKRTAVSIAGSGDAKVWATEALSASIAGSGDVRYQGDPAISRSVVGSGTVRRLESASR